MPLLRINATTEGPQLHGSPVPARRVIQTAARSKGPVIIMVHGFKYDPETPRFCPHTSIFDAPLGHKRDSWPAALGFAGRDPNEGLAVAFAWRARGTLWHALRTAAQAGQNLAQVIAIVKRTAPARAVHVICHSMGSEVFFEALHHLPAHSIQRAIILTAASYQSRASSALHTDAGQALELFNITSRENDLFDAGFETLIKAATPSDRAVGAGLFAPNAVNIEIDCDLTLQRLRLTGADIAPAARRISHWSAYMRPGLMPFYNSLLRRPSETPLAALRHALPPVGSQRFARLLPFMHKPQAGLSAPL
ncbi:alpha/beta hydrolase [Ascidiaceihabitans sp.]|uniref:alpha/beta hydrolase n=1 Tax=Ascidiaceihabitans sp. TaxID=1872644 RepID=UPI0032976119